jgi:hypothetical protein
MFSERLINRLTETEYWHIEGEGKIITFSKFQFQRNKKHDDSQLVNSRLQDIRYLFRLLSEESAVMAG